MTEPNSPKNDKQKQVHGYNRMLERVKEFITGAEEDISVRLQHALDAAKDKASELGELTREESEQIADYLKRDLHDAADYLSSENKEMRDWLRFDVQLVEAKLIDWMSQAVDTTKLELEQLAERAQQENIWMTGEVAAPGTFQCMKCGHELQFKATTQLPPCPKCDKHRFKRISN